MSLFKPRYARDFIWSDHGEPRLTLAKTTETASPVSELPDNEHHNTIAISTISSHPDLFKIVSPIKVDVFERKLHNHLNQPFVQSVCRSLREGFWPWADTNDPSHPNTYDNLKREIKEQMHRDFLIEQVWEEVELGQFSRDFGPELLPGMYSQPIGVVPKPHSDKFRMVVDQSAELYSLNSMIPKDERRVHLDNLHNLGDVLQKVQNRFGRDICLVCWKSDISRAYRLMPVHPHWQIRQVVTVKAGQSLSRYVNHCNHFGNGAGGRVFICFNGLVV